jgi:hypothetical protein
MKKKNKKIIFSLIAVILTALTQYVNIYYAESLPYVVIAVTSVIAGLKIYLEESEEKTITIYLYPTKKRANKKIKR